MLEFCATCLSSNRLLTPLESLGDILISMDWLIKELNIKQVKVCWECRGILMKMHKFKQKALWALHKHSCWSWTHSDLGQATIFECLTTLSQTTKVSYDLVLYHEDVVKCEFEDNYELHTAEINKYDEEIIKPESIENDNICEIYLSSEPDSITNLPVPNETKETTHEKKPKISRSNKKNKNVKTIKREPNMTLSKDEQKFIVTKMTIEDVYKCRDVDRNMNRYNKCPYKCVKCITGYFNEDKYNAHVENRHLESIGKYVCKICEVRYKREEALQCHYGGHFRLYQCRQCPREHHRLSTMLIHLTNEHGTEHYPCKLCGKLFLKPRDLRYHNEKFHKERPKCHVCEKTFVTTYSLKHHISTSHGKSVALEECPQCGGRYRSLRAHLRTHDASLANDAAYCAECGKQFKNAYTYRQHLIASKRHRAPDALKFACTMCDAKFTARPFLNLHVASIHTREFRFYCDHCGKGYLRKDRLKNHILEIHLGVSRPKDKICPYCGKGFKERGVLAAHVRTHTGARPHACAHPRCAARFVQRAAARAHLRKVHRQPPTAGATL